VAADSGEIGQAVRSNQAVEFLRVVQQHHIQLSSMADFKANVLLGASLLIFSTSLKEVRDGHASIPLILLLATSFTSAALVVMAMLPATSRRHDPSPNLLFFGAFAQMSEDEFQQQMGDLLQDEHKLHRAMIRDIYQLGRVLHTKKYRRLGQAYQVFFYGLMPTGLLVLVQASWKLLRL
jgi:pycsar effector protein